MFEYDDLNLALDRSDAIGSTTDGIVSAKVIAMVVLSCATFMLGFIPILLSRWLKWNQPGQVEVERTKKSRRALSLLLSFGGGALLCTTFMHMLPEVNENVTSLQDQGLIPHTEFHLANLIACGGFFMMYFIEELVHLYLHSREDKDKKKYDSEEVLHRSFSMRKCSTASSKTSSISISSMSLEKSPKGHNHQDHDHQGHSHEGHSHQPNEQSCQQNGGHNHQHGHSHVMMPQDERKDTVTSLRGLLIVVALSVHELFEGLAVGLETSTGGVYYMFGAVASHKLVLAFCVGLELVSAKTKMTLNVLYMLTFALVSPVGIAIGIGLSQANNSGNGVLNVILQGIASGTLLYVVFFEVLTRERFEPRTNGLTQLFAIIIGFCTMFGLLMAAGHEHEHNDSDVTTITAHLTHYQPVGTHLSW